LSFIEAIINFFSGAIFRDAIMADLNRMYITGTPMMQSAISDVGMTPQAWNGAVFSLIQNLSQTVILPIAGVILTFVVTYELITIIMEKNNMADFDTFNIYKWIIKTLIAIFILTNTWSIVIGIFDLAQQVVSNSSGLMLDSEIMNTSLLAEFEAQIADMEFFQLLGLWFQVQIAGLLMNILAIAIMAVVWGRMIEIYLITSIAPIPLATITNREYGQMGNNYLKNLFAVAFQGFLIMVCIGIHMAMSSALLVGATDASVSLWQMVGTTVILVFMLFKTGSIAKSIFGAH